MDDDALAGTRVLVVGGDRDAAESLRARLADAGSPAVGHVPAELVVAEAAETRPAIVVCLGDADTALVRAQLDPLGLEAGPAVVALAELDGGGVGRLRSLLDARALRARVTELEAVVAEQALTAYREAEAIRADTLARLARAAEYSDDNSPEHMQRVAALAARIARGLGADDRLVALIRLAAPLHDLGKIAIPDTILLKPGKLDPEEFEVVKTHSVLGARVLADAGSELLQVAEQICLSHHERWDGGGYPEGLAGDEIPLVARVVGVADVFDVLVHERPYKDAWTVDDAASEIRSGAGTQFDPGAVAAFDALGIGSWTAGHESG